MLTIRLAPLALSTVLLMAACTGSAPSPTPSPAPTAAPTLAIDHPTGATDVVLRMSTGGGFVAPGFMLTEVPEFTLYGDGTVVFRDPAAVPVAPVPDDGVFRSAPFKSARLTESQVQELLAFAIGPGGLGIARDMYEPGGIADAPSTTFTLNADARHKSVTVGALDFDQPQPGPDTAARTAFRTVADRLRHLDQEIAAGPFAPVGYRGILADGAGGVLTAPPHAWPWTFGPDGFKAPADPSAFASLTRTLTADDVAALGISGIAGGAQSIALRTAGGKVYTLSLRPLLPDENV